MTRRWPWLVPVLMALAAQMLLGCGTVTEVRRGGLGDGQYLLTLRVVSIARAARECDRVNARGCVRVQWVRVPGATEEVGAVTIIVTELTPEIVAHEACHGVARVQFHPLDDPCHREDRGVLAPPRRPGGPGEPRG